jgi:rifampicin phosphotransferase
LRSREQLSWLGDPGDVEWQSPIAGALWLRTWRLGEWVHGPLSPLFRTFLVPMLVEARERAGTGRLGQRLPRMWRVKSPAYCVVNGYFFARAEPSAVSLMVLPVRFFISEALGGWTERWEAETLPTFLKRVANHGALDVEGSSTELLLARLEELALDVAECWYAIGLASGGSVPLKRFLGGILKADFSDVDILTLLRGFQTSIIGGQRHLYNLAQSARQAGILGRADAAQALATAIAAGGAADSPQDFGAQLTLALAEVGHQINTLDFVHPCLQESPADLAVALDAYGRRSARNPDIALQKSAAERDQISNRIRDGLSTKKRRIFNRLLAALHRYETVLDNTTFDIQRAWPIFRRYLREIGGRLYRDGRLDAADDVFFLAYDDLRRACLDRRGAKPSGADTWAVTARDNRRLWLRQHDLDPPRCIPPPGDPAWDGAMTWPINLRAICGARAPHDWILRGIAASPGSRTGRARVCRTLEDAASLEPGEILVTVRTTPNWTPLFSQVAAIVTDVGAATSHSSIIAREFRIPAVVGTQQATRVVKDGDQVTVDGTAGLVHLELQSL